MSWGGMVGLALAAVALRTIDLGAVPRWFTDEGLWAMPPRDFVLFSYWSLGPWLHFYLSPVYSAVLVAWFAACGPGIVQARVLDALLGVVAVGGVLLLARQLQLRSTVAMLAATALAFDGPSIITDRSVLLESLQTVAVLACAIVAVGNWPHRRLLLAAGFAFALLTKLLSAEIALPLLVYAMMRDGYRGAARDALALVGGVGVAIAVFGLIAIPDPRGFATTWQGEFGIRSIGGAYEEATSLRATVLYFVTRAPVLLIGTIGSLVWLITRRRTSGALGFLGVWVAIGLAAMALQGYTPPRYFVPLIPYAWLLIFAALDDVRRTAEWPWACAAAPLTAALAAVFTLGSLVGYYYVLGNRDTRGARVAEFIDATVERGATVLGPPELVVSTRAIARGWDSVPESYRTERLLPEELDALHIRYVVTTSDTPRPPPAEAAEGNRFVHIADFGDIRLYRLTPQLAAQGPLNGDDQ